MGLEVHQLTHGYVERTCDANENVDAYISRSCFDLPERGTADAQNPGQSQDRNVFRKMRTQILPCHGVGGPAALMRT